MTKLLPLLALLLAPAISSAADEPLPAARFAFLHAGETKLAAARSTLGDPKAEYPAYLPDGEIDVFVGSASTQAVDQAVDRAADKKREVVAVRVLEYPFSEETIERAKLVFKGDTLFYAMLPASPSESTPEKIAARYGKEPKKSQRQRMTGDVLRTANLYAYPEDGVAYVETGGHIRWKVIFAPVR